MNISKLNPIGYEAKTDKGNTYKKSNIATTVLVLGSVALDTAVYTGKAGKFAKMFTLANIFDDIIKPVHKNISPKLKTPINALGVAIDMLFALWIGQAIDKSINKKRMEKADGITETKA